MNEDTPSIHNDSHDEIDINPYVAGKDMDIFKMYLRDIDVYQRIDRKKEKELSEIIHTSSDPKKIKAAKDEFMLANLKLVVKTAFSVYTAYRYNSSFNISLMDLISEGNILLIRCVERFDAKKYDFAFSTYAMKSLARIMIRFVQSTNIIRLPEYHYKSMATLHQIKVESGKNVSDEIIMEKTKWRKSKVDVMKHSNQTFVDKHIDMQEMAEMIPDGKDFYDDISKRDVLDYYIRKINELLPAAERDAVMNEILDDKAYRRDSKIIFNVSRPGLESRLYCGLKKLRNSLTLEDKNLLNKRITTYDKDIELNRRTNKDVKNSKLKRKK